MPFSVSHFELAKKLEIDSLDFHVGNLVPDINHYSQLFTKEQTHYITHEPLQISGDIDAFVEKNLKHKELDQPSYLFRLGHLVHLITDRMWREIFYIPVFSRYKDQQEQTRRYFSTQLRFLNSLFARWENENPGYKEEFIRFKKYNFSRIDLSYPFHDTNPHKLSSLLKTLIDIQFSIKQTFYFKDEELYRYEKELKRYIPDNYYEIFLEKTVEEVRNVCEKYELKIE